MEKIKVLIILRQTKEGHHSGNDGDGWSHRKRNRL